MVNGIIRIRIIRFFVVGLFEEMIKILPSIVFLFSSCNVLSLFFTMRLSCLIGNLILFLIMI